jgi:curli biogenesis system outer membrane secretion channel CsgG
MSSRPLIPMAERLLFIGLSLSTLACAPQIAVTRLKPAEISLHGVKQIAITGITGSGGKELEGLLAQKIQASNRFVLVERGHLDKVLSELGKSTNPEFQDGDNKVGQLLPASALVWGNVDRSDFEQATKTENTTCSKIVGFGLKPKTQKYPCKKSERTAKATVTVQFRVFETATARILAAKTLTATQDRMTMAEDAEPAAIDGKDLKQACHQIIAADFIKVIAPFEVQEKVKLVEENTIPEVQQGNEYLKRGDNASAMEFYGKAMARAKGDPSIAPKAKARAIYAHGIGSALVGDYDTAIAEIRAANAVAQESAWMDMEVRVKQWQAEARKVDDQRKTGTQSGSASTGGEAPKAP